MITLMDVYNAFLSRVNEDNTLAFKLLFVDKPAS